MYIRTFKLKKNTDLSRTDKIAHFFFIISSTKLNVDHCIILIDW